MNNQRMVLFDLDDTLLNSKKFISEANVSAISKCKSLGMVIGYITARSPRKIKNFLKDLPCDCIAYYNGAAIEAQNIIIERNEIPYEDGIRTISEIKNAYPEALIGAHLEPYKYFNGQITNINTQESNPVNIQEIPQYNIQRILVTQICKDISQHTNENMNCLASVSGSVVITSKKANKENAMRRFAEHFNIGLSDVIVFGDDVNDLNMIKTAGIGVAMGNAIDDVKIAADFICETNDNDGVSKWLEGYLLKTSSC